MKKLSDAQVCVLKALASDFYEVVPLEFRTYCTLTSEISARTLRHFDIACEVVACQLWHVRHGSNIVVGFIRPEPLAGKWDGHAICVAGDWFIDAALHQLNVEFGLQVPALAIGRLFAVPSQAISRLDLNATDQLWWHKPPTPDPPIPVVAPELAVQYADELVRRIGQRQLA